MEGLKKKIVILILTYLVCTCSNVQKRDRDSTSELSIKSIDLHMKSIDWSKSKLHQVKDKVNVFYAKEIRNQFEFYILLIKNESGDLNIFPTYFVKIGDDIIGISSAFTNEFYPTDTGEIYEADFKDFLNKKVKFKDNNTFDFYLVDNNFNLMTGFSKGLEGAGFQNFSEYYRFKCDSNGYILETKIFVSKKVYRIDMNSNLYKIIACLKAIPIDPPKDMYILEVNDDSPKMLSYYYYSKIISKYYGTDVEKALKEHVFEDIFSSEHFFKEHPVKRVQFYEE